MAQLGFTAADFYYIVPEIVLTLGALLVLAVGLLVTKRERDDLALPDHHPDALRHGRGCCSRSPASTPSASRGLLAIDGFALFFKGVFLLARGRHGT